VTFPFHLLYYYSLLHLLPKRKCATCCNYCQLQPSTTAQFRLIIKLARTDELRSNPSFVLAQTHSTSSSAESRVCRDLPRSGSKLQSRTGRLEFRPGDSPNSYVEIQRRQLQGTATPFPGQARLTSRGQPLVRLVPSVS
jgi:hypothetical protein